MELIIWWGCNPSPRSTPAINWLRATLHGIIFFACALLIIKMCVVSVVIRKKTIMHIILIIEIIIYRISSNLSDTSNYPGHSFGQFSLF